MNQAMVKSTFIWGVPLCLKIRLDTLPDSIKHITNLAEFDNNLMKVVVDRKN